MKDPIRDAARRDNRITCLMLVILNVILWSGLYLAFAAFMGAWPWHQ